MSDLRRQAADLRREADQFDRLNMHFIADVNREEANALEREAEDENDSDAAP